MNFSTTATNVQNISVTGSIQIEHSGGVDVTAVVVVVTVVRAKSSIAVADCGFPSNINKLVDFLGPVYYP